MKPVLLFVGVCVLMISPFHAWTAGSDTSQREAPICGPLKEPFVFWLWSRMAPRAKPARATRRPNVEAVSFTTGDDKVLSGYRFRAHDERDEPVEPKGYVLMALGNAMIADQMISELSTYAKSGYDAYIYDYRGYGLSEGKRRINAIIEDYREIVADLNTRYERKMLYGVSLGGMVMMNAIGSGVEFDAAVIDSAPSRLSSYGCPDRIDPVNHLSEAVAPKLLIITGKRDQVLGSKDTRELREKAGELGAKTYNGDDFAHPYMDRAFDVHLQRARLVREHLLPPPATPSH